MTAMPLVDKLVSYTNLLAEEIQSLQRQEKAYLDILNKLHITLNSFDRNNPVYRERIETVLSNVKSHCSLLESAIKDIQQLLEEGAIGG